MVSPVFVLAYDEFKTITVGQLFAIVANYETVSIVLFFFLLSASSNRRSNRIGGASHDCIVHTEYEKQGETERKKNSHRGTHVLCTWVPMYIIHIRIHIGYVMSFSLAVLCFSRGSEIGDWK